MPVDGFNCPAGHQYDDGVLRCVPVLALMVPYYAIGMTAMEILLYGVMAVRQVNARGYRPVDLVPITQGLNPILVRGPLRGLGSVLGPPKLWTGLWDEGRWDLVQPSVWSSRFVLALSQAASQLPSVEDRFAFTSKILYTGVPPPRVDEILELWLENRDDVSFIVGPARASLAELIAPVAAVDGVPCISFGATATPLSQASR